FAELRLVRKAFQYAGIRMANVLINLGLNLYLILGLGWGIEAVFIANLAASGLTTLFIWVLTAKMWRGNWSGYIFRKAIRFGLPLVPAGLGYAVNEMLDRFFLNNYMSQQTVTNLYGAGVHPAGVVGIYSACYKLAVFMLLLIQMFRMAWQPFFLRHADDEEAPALYAEVFLHFNAIAGAVFLGIALFAHQIVHIHIPILNAYLIDPKFWSGLSIVPLVLGAYWFHGWYMNFSAGIYIEEKTGIFSQITLLGALITLGGCFLFIPYLGMMGAALATLISYGSMALVLCWRVQHVYPVPYPYKKVIFIMALSVGFYLLQVPVSRWIGTEWIANIFLFLIGAGGIAGVALASLKKFQF
ncbi:MAG TPA: polysaccharide biosynthesis C-terminal domain-containing protein, partial [Balneolaceae bacterium]|nr:polysaccharide biosynthesis C-terminal domain-containing protein [Balneolaceae bacterium]